MFALCQFKRNFFSKQFSNFLSAVFWIVLHWKLQMSLKPDFLICFCYWKGEAFDLNIFQFSKSCIVWRVQTVNWYSKKFEINDWAQCQYIKYCILASYNQTFAHFLAASLPFSPHFWIGESSIKIVKVRADENVGVFLIFFRPGEVHLTAGTAGFINITALTLVRSEQKLE